MNTVLWVLQCILALKFASVAISHAVRPSAKVQGSMRRFGAAARPLLTLISLVCVLGALGLVLPAVAAGFARFVPWSAAFLAAWMLLGMAFHVRCRGWPNLAVGVVLFLLAAFLAYGRWVLAPL